jgi:glycosyltransferase involved in cell wall biosynthesis
VRVENVMLPPEIPVLRHVVITYRLVRRVLALRPDAIHCFKPKAYAGLAAWTLWWLQRLGLAGARLVVDSDDWEGFGGWNELEPYSWAQKQFFAWQERWGLRHNDALTVASRTLQSIAWSLRVPPELVWYVPNGIGRLQIVDGQPRTVHREGKTVLLYTRFFEFGLERVVSAFRQVREMRPVVRFLIVGQGLFGEETRFLELCHAAGLAEAVEYVGWNGVRSLPGHFERTDVAVYPFDDTLVNRTKCAVKLLELMAAGVPVVAEAVGQNTATIEHGVSGLLVPPGDGAAFAAAVVRLLDDPDLRERLSRGARHCVRESFTWEHLSSWVERAYTGSWDSSVDLAP